MENNKREDKFSQVLILIIAILLFVGTIAVCFIAFDMMFGVFADIEKDIYVADKKTVETVVVEKEDTSTTIINEYNVDIDNSINITIGNENNDININVNIPNTPANNLPANAPACAEYKDTHCCYTDKYNKDFTYNEYFWNPLIKERNFDSNPIAFKNTYNKKYIEIKGFISSINGEYCILKMKSPLDTKGNDYMIYCNYNSMVKNWIESNSICDKTNSSYIPVIIRGQINDGFSLTRENNKLFNIDVWCVEVGG